MRINRLVKAAALAIAIVLLGLGTTGRAQQQVQRTLPTVVPVKVDVVISRFVGDKKISSLPFVLPVNANERAAEGYPLTAASLRMGVDIPLGMETRTTGPGGGSTASSVTTTSSTYQTFRNVGTSIDCTAETQDDGHIKLMISIQDSSIYTADPEGKPVVRTADPMAYRVFTSKNTLYLKSGQKLDYTMAGDKISGEVVKIEVTATIAK